MSKPAAGQFYPLKIRLENEEPFLRLKRNKNIVLTPPRESDGPALCSLMNDPRINEWSLIPVLPYSAEVAQVALNDGKMASNETLYALSQAQSSQEFVVVGTCPVDTLRLVQPNGTDTLIGGIHITRCDRGEFLGPTGPEIIDWGNEWEHLADNQALEVGDPDIVWSMGVYLCAGLHGRGIVSDAVRTVLHDWAIPRMGVRRMLVFTFEGNDASVKVFLKNGFKYLFTSPEHLEVRGVYRSLNVLKWELEG